MKYEKLFRKYVGKLSAPGSDGEAKGLCPFHKDHTPSFSVNLATGMWRCFAGSCGQQGGVAKFTALVGGKDIVASSQPAHAAEAPTIDPVIVEQCVRTLQESPKHMKFLIEIRGLSPIVIAQQKIGWDGARFTIPVFDEENNLEIGRAHV